MDDPGAIETRQAQSVPAFGTADLQKLCEVLAGGILDQSKLVEGARVERVHHAAAAAAGPEGACSQLAEGAEAAPEVVVGDLVAEAGSPVSGWMPSALWRFAVQHQQRLVAGFLQQPLDLLGARVDFASYGESVGFESGGGDPRLRQSTKSPGHGAHDA